jgi:FAD/FMN-containing dehydrogenase
MPPPVAHLVPAVQAARDALEPYGTGGTAVNLHGYLSAPELAAAAWPEEMHARMRSGKAELDPQNLFRHGHTIVPRPLETEPITI